MHAAAVLRSHRSAFTIQSNRRRPIPSAIYYYNICYFINHISQSRGMDTLSLKDWTPELDAGFLDIICEYEHLRDAFERIGVEWDAFLVWVSH